MQCHSQFAAKASHYSSVCWCSLLGDLRAAPVCEWPSRPKCLDILYIWWFQSHLRRAEPQRPDKTQLFTPILQTEHFYQPLVALHLLSHKESGSGSVSTKPLRKELSLTCALVSTTRYQSTRGDYILLACIFQLTATELIFLLHREKLKAHLRGQFLIN